MLEPDARRGRAVALPRGLGQLSQPLCALPTYRRGLLEAVGVKWLSRVKLWVSTWHAAGAGAFAVQWEKRTHHPSQQTLGVKKLPPPDPLKETFGAAPKGI